MMCILLGSASVAEICINVYIFVNVLLTCVYLAAFCSAVMPLRVKFSDDYYQFFIVSVHA